MCSWGSLCEIGGALSRETPNLSWKKLVWMMMQTRAILVVGVSGVK
jgi:hypothetical protein